jgi:hypothetical protein
MNLERLPLRHSFNPSVITENPSRCANGLSGTNTVVFGPDRTSSEDFESPLGLDQARMQHQAGLETYSKKSLTVSSLLKSRSYTRTSSISPSNGYQMPRRSAPIIKG